MEIKNVAQSMEKSNRYIYPYSTSFLGRAIKFFLRLNKDKTAFEKRFAENKFNDIAAPVPKKYLKDFTVETETVAGRTVYTLTPRQAKSGTVILYIHGGAYISNIFKIHWDLIAELIRKTKATVVVPDYPLAPKYTVKEAFPMVLQVYKNLQKLTSPGNVVFMGDSAGGGLALALAENLKKDGSSQPQQIILLSPWLDITTSNPDMVAIEKKDPMLSISGLKVAGKSFAGELDTKNYLVSPIYGNLHGLARISIFIGGEDIFIADARKFRTMLDKENIPFNYYEYPKMFHVWVAITFLKEAKHAIAQMSLLINNN